MKQVVYGLIVHIHELSDLFVLQPFDKTVLDDHFLTYRQVVQKLVQLFLPVEFFFVIYQLVQRRLIEGESRFTFRNIDRGYDFGKLILQLMPESTKKIEFDVIGS